MASAQKIVAVPTLADLLNDPERISALPKDVIAELRGQIARLDTLLLSWLLTGEQPHPGTDEDCVRKIRHFYLGPDRNGDQALKSIRASLNAPAPNFVLDTSLGKHQVMWKARGTDKEQAKSLLLGMAARFGGDPAATSSTRVLRLPGFANRKLSEKFVVQVRYEADAVYTLRDFAIEEERPGTSHDIADTREGRTLAQGHKSQSEHDWACAKRALTRGDDPQDVIRKIADFRSDDKSDPQYCALHTVTKAAAELRRYNPASEKADVSETETIDLNQEQR
jgi:hypothetical protein